MQTWTKRDFFTYLILFVLLFIRFPIAEFAVFLEKVFHFVSSSNLETLRLIQSQSLQILYGYSYILVAIVILINRGNLDKLNMDIWFMLIFLGGGLAYKADANLKLGLVTALWQLELVIALIALYAFVFGVIGVQKNQNEKPKLLRIILVILIGFFLGILLIADSINFIKIVSAVYWFLFFLPHVIVEEVMFRGILWMFLRNLNFSEFKIVILQAMLFWFSHVNSANDYFFFWVIIPIMSALLGTIVWRYKSITPSIIAHILFNILSSLINTRNL